MIARDLIGFGLSEKEAKVYISLLKLEIASVNEISKYAGINRSTTYVVLDSLARQGFAAISEDKNVKRYSAASPETLLRSAENNVVKYENIKKEIERVVPEMMALHKDTKKKPVIKIYEGKQGLINLFEHSLKNNKEKFMRVYSSPGSLNSIIPDYMNGYIEKRFKLGIKMHGIHSDIDAHKKFEIMRKKLFGKQTEDNKNSDVSIMLPASKYSFPADLAIYDNIIGYMSKDGGGLSIIIESKEIADVMKNIFDLAWEEAKRVSVYNSK